VRPTREHVLSGAQLRHGGPSVQNALLLGWY
jgi:hypothetical protein